MPTDLQEEEGFKGKRISHVRKCEKRKKKIQKGMFFKLKNGLFQKILISSLVETRYHPFLLIKEGTLITVPVN